MAPFVRTLSAFVGVELDDAADTAANRQRVLQAIGTLDRNGVPTVDYADAVRPAEIVDAEDNRSTPTTVAIAIAAFAAAGLGVASWASVRARRRELAVLRTLGLSSEQIRRTVWVQSLATIVGRRGHRRADRGHRRARPLAQLRRPARCRARPRQPSRSRRRQRRRRPRSGVHRRPAPRPPRRSLQPRRRSPRRVTPLPSPRTTATPARGGRHALYFGMGGDAAASPPREPPPLPPEEGATRCTSGWGWRGREPSPRTTATPARGGRHALYFGMGMGTVVVSAGNRHRRGVVQLIMRSRIPLALVAAFVLVACGSAEPSGSDATVPPASDDVTSTDAPPASDDVPTTDAPPASDDVTTSDTPISDAPPASDGPTTTDSTPPEDDVQDLVNRRWIVDATVTIAGPQPVPAASKAELTIAPDGRLTLHTGCNQGSGTVTFNGDGTFDVGPIATTKMACLDDAVSAVESSVLTTLSGTVAWSVDGATLTLTPTMVSDSGLRLRDDQAPPVSTPADRGTLLERLWVVESFITVGSPDVVPEGIVASLSFDDAGGISVDTSCNTGSGSVTYHDDGSFTVTDLAVTERGCTGDSAAVETRVLAQLGHTLFFLVEDDLLTVYPSDISDTGMKLRATP